MERTGQRILIVDSTAFVERFGAEDGAEAAIDELRETAATRESVYTSFIPRMNLQVVPDTKQLISSLNLMSPASAAISEMVKSAMLADIAPSWRTALLGPQSSLTTAAIFAAANPGPRDSLAAASVAIAEAQAAVDTHDAAMAELVSEAEAEAEAS
jgi:hypothetical protein